jgi:hypothetical protein
MTGRTKKESQKVKGSHVLRRLRVVGVDIHRYGDTVILIVSLSLSLSLSPSIYTDLPRRGPRGLQALAFAYSASQKSQFQG